MTEVLILYNLEICDKIYLQLKPLFHNLVNNHRLCFSQRVEVLHTITGKSLENFTG